MFNKIKCKSSIMFFMILTLAVTAFIPATATTLSDWESIRNNYSQISLAPGADESKLNFAWYSSTNATPVVQITKVSALVDGEFPEATESFAGNQTTAYYDRSKNIQYYSNKVTVSGLEAATEYKYRYKVGNEAWSEAYDYSTKDISEKLTFIAVGDPQLGCGLNGVKGDTERWTRTLNVANKIAPDASFLYSVGDQVDTNSEEQYAGFLSPSVLKSLPLATVAGNHDCDTATLSWHFNNPNMTKYGETNSGGDYYFSYGNDVLLIGINANAILKSSKSDNEITVEHRKAIEEAIASAPYAKWRIIVLHQDIYGYPYHYDDAEVKKIREQMYPIIDDYNIDTVITGHGHNFTRSYQMENNSPVGVLADYNSNNVVTENPDGTVYFELSTAASKNYLNNLPGSTSHIAASFDEMNTQSFSVVDVTNANLSIKTYKTNSMDDSYEAEVYDSYSIIKTDRAILDKAIKKAENLLASDLTSCKEELVSALEVALNEAKIQQGALPENGKLNESYDAANKLTTFINALKPINYGDITEDGNINLSDVITLQKYLAGSISLTEAQLNAADVNKDGQLDSSDVEFLKKYLIGITE